jgi:integrase
MPIYRKKINGRKVYWVRVNYKRLNGSRICETRESAQDAEAELRVALKKKAGEVETAGLRPATMKQLFEAYVADLEARGKGSDTITRAAQTATVLEALLPELLTKPVGKITDADVFAVRQARARAGVKPSTINRDLRTIRAMLKKARPEYRFPGGAFFPEDETRVRWLRPEEEILVLDTMPSPFQDIAKLAALTLMRLSEIRLLRREMVHLEQGVVLLPRAKAGARPVVLSELARKILQRQLETHDKAWVFPGPDGAPYSRVHVSRVFRKAARAAGLKDFHFHDLRHHGATMALNAGFTAPIVMQLGGWKSEKMMRRYAAVTDQTLRAAAEAVSGTPAPLEARRVRGPSVLRRDGQRRLGPAQATAFPTGRRYLSEE